MIWLILTILIAAYIIARAIKDNSPKPKINTVNIQVEKLEAQATHYLSEAIKEQREYIVKLNDDLEKDKDRTLLKDCIKSSEKAIQDYNDFEIKYTSLKEKLKHNSPEEKLAIAQDWKDITEIWFSKAMDYKHKSQYMDYYMWASKEERDTEDQNIKKEQAEVREIVKRFDKMLKD